MSTVTDLFDELDRMRLAPDDWESVRAELAELDPDRPDETAVTQIVFEARVQQRFHGGRAASTLPPTKQTSALPWVGLVCAGVLLGVGGALGGGIVLAGVAALGVFVFGIALAGSRVAHRRGTSVDEEPREPPAPMPPSVRAVVDRLRVG